LAPQLYDSFILCFDTVWGAHVATWSSVTVPEPRLRNPAPRGGHCLSVSY